MKNKKQTMRGYNDKKSFNFEEWPVYKLSLEFCDLAFKMRSVDPKIGLSSLIDQLKRASSSIPLNLAEGYSRFTNRDKISFLRFAKGSAFECVSIINILNRVGAIDKDMHAELYCLLRDISRMLSGMMNYLSKSKKENS